MNGTHSGSQIDIDYFRQIESESLPVAKLLGVSLLELGQGWARAMASYQSSHLRPGGTLAGPVMMTLADYVAYAAVLSQVGPVEMAVTSNLAINFLSKPQPSDLIAHGKVLRAGRRLVYCDVKIHSNVNNKQCDGSTKQAVSPNGRREPPRDNEPTRPKPLVGSLVAQVSVIYALPG